MDKLDLEDLLVQEGTLDQGEPMVSRESKEGLDQQVQTVRLDLRAKEVLLVSLEQPEVQGNLDQLEPEVTLVHEVTLVPEGHREPEAKSAALGQLVRQDRQDRLVYLDLQDQPVREETLEVLDLRVNVDNQDHLDHRDRQGQPVHLANEGTPEVKEQADCLGNLEVKVKEETQVPPVHLDRLGPKDQLGNQDLLGPLGHEASLVHRALQVLLGQLEPQGLQEAPALLDPEVTKDQMEHLDRKGLLVQEEVLVHKEHLEDLDLKDHPETQARQEVKDQQDRLDNVEIQDQLDSKEQVVSLDRLVNKDHRDQQGSKGLPVRPAQRDKEETADSPEALVHEEIPEHQDLLASQGRRVQMVPQDSRDQRVQQGQGDRRAPEGRLAPTVSQDFLATLGRKDSKDPEVIRVLKALLVQLDLLDLEGLQETKDQEVSQDSLEQTAVQVPQEVLDQLVKLDQEETLVLRAQMVNKDHPVLREKQGLLDQEDPVAPEATLVKGVKLVHLGLPATEAIQVHPALLVPLVQLDLQVPKVPVDQGVVLGLVEHKVLLEMPDHQDPRGRQAREETLDQQDLLDLLDQSDQ